MAQFGTSLRRPSPETPDDAMPRIDADNIVTFPASTTRDGGATALDLIYQAAEIFTGIENRARDIEANARAMCQNAVDKLLDAERRVQTAEQARRDIIADVDRRLQDVALALADAQARIDAADARATSADKRAAAAEAEAQTARRLLTQVEDAIRSRLLGEDIDAHAVRRASA
jgi:hypothetical protein